MNVLGISCHYHDAAAALTVGGELQAAAAEERFTRIKHDVEFPKRAIAFCLEQTGLEAADLDAVAFYEKPIRKFDRILIQSLATFPRSWSFFRRAIPLGVRDRLRIGTKIRTFLGERPEVLYVPHHTSHAASAFLPSPFERAVILTMDGVGEWATAVHGTGEGNRINLEREIRFPHSLGLLYSAITAYLGFEVNDGEWKVMGLAPYGEPEYVDRIRGLIDVKPDGSFRLRMEYFTHDYSTRRMFNRRFEELLGRPARVPESEIEPFHQDVARSVQEVVEEVILAIARDLHARYGLSDLCIAGGVGLNCVANWKVLDGTPFERIFIQPAAGDDGGAIGASLFVSNVIYKESRKTVMRHAYYGPAFDDAAVESFLTSEGLPARKLDRQDLLDTVAEAIAAGKVVGWFQGRMEFGPRSLGGRSILADPRNPEMKRIINEKIKFREWFRPFAPSVTIEDAHRYFEMPEGMEAPFMLLVPPVRPEWREKLPAITHVDGSARVQTIARDVNPLYYDLLRAVEKRTGIPCVINTSFNVRGEPIVCTPRDAIHCFTNTGIDALALGNYYLSKNGGGDPA